MKHLWMSCTLLFTTGALASDYNNELYEKFSNEHKHFTKVRQEFHQIAETKYEEFATSSLVAQHLKSYGYSVSPHYAFTGIIAILDSGLPGKTVALRADMDGLPILEETSLTYSSKYKGKMHACGHDGHMATLLMVAKVLKEGNYLKSGKIKFLFQPAEEGGAGADRMIKAGALENPHVDAIFGYHNWPMELGTIATRVGCLMAGTDRFDINIQGKGGHAAMPQLTINPLYTAGEIILSSQLLMSQKNPTHPAVLNITSIHGGTTYNVVPSEVKLQGTLRTTTPEDREFLVKKLTTLCQKTSESHDTSAKVTFVPDNYPPLLNTKNEVDLVLQTAKEIIDQEKVTLLDQPVMPGEDFAFYLQKVPGCFFFVGYGVDKPGLHDSHYDYNDTIMPKAAYVLAKTALNYLNSN